ncbi:MAG: hypothetical protein E7J70_04220 [Veillonella sp.]|nr:hypothetical protein [Veillonella sp.]
MSVNQFMINNSILNEKDLDKLQKQYNYQYYQAACHGSSHDFDLFDLGAIRLTTEQGLNKIRVSPNDSMVTIYEMTKDINDGYGTLHIDVNGNPEFYILIPAT